MVSALLIGALALPSLFLGLAIFKLFSHKNCKIKKDLTGKVVIVTGANTGLGKETAYALAKMNATVILASRDPKKSIEALEDIKRRSGSSNVEFIRLDLADLSSVKTFVEDFKKKYNRLDILINNAGVFTSERQVTKDGYESQFAINHLGPFYLTSLLLDLIKKSAPSRIINVSSDGHRACKGIKKEDVLSEKGFRLFFSYCKSKYANVVFTRALQSRLEEDDVKVVSLHPGTVRTDLTRTCNDKWFSKIMIKMTIPMMYTVGKSVEEGIQTTLQCALEDHDKLVGGAYYTECKPVSENPLALKQEQWVKLWDLSEELISKAIKN